jgi:hypothetical protein
VAQIRCTVSLTVKERGKRTFDFDLSGILGVAYVHD